ncbi:MAG TPA: hypothetical protein VFB50_19405, partial [Chloroflexota bacterium]|nr:hypothetical protein [Chloroflexota bacterium]
MAVRLQVIALEWPPYTGPEVTWHEDMGKKRGQVMSPTGERSCAEVEIVRLLRDGGWGAGWISEYREASKLPEEWRKAMLDERVVPPDVLQQHER